MGRTYAPDAHHAYEFDDLSPQELIAAWRTVATTPWWWWKLPPLTDCWARIDALTKERPVYFVTARNVGTPEVLFQTASWLRCMGVENPCVIRTEMKGILAGVLRAGWMLDDEPSHIHAAREEHTGITAVLLARPYNRLAQGDVIHSGGHIVSSVEQFLGMVQTRG